MMNLLYYFVIFMDIFVVIQHLSDITSDLMYIVTSIVTNILPLIPGFCVERCNKVPRVRVFQVSLLPHSSSDLVVCQIP